ncbi:MAG: histidine triad nucleotide-binding protein [Elusimicrobia bacterium]|nr:histidine triad nucleotide-binding protein [Elusimicrobiota bacterium]
MKQSKDCLFCKIANKEIKSNIIFENDKLLAFSDINPQAPVHILIIPKKHITGLNEIGVADKELLGEIQLAAKEIAEKNNISKDGYRIVANCGPNAGQAVDHIHYHLLGGRIFGWPPG